MNLSKRDTVIAVDRSANGTAVLQNALKDLNNSSADESRDPTLSRQNKEIREKNLELSQKLAYQQTLLEQNAKEIS